MKVACIQMNSQECVSDNLQAMHSWLEKVKDADYVFFPETVDYCGKDPKIMHKRCLAKLRKNLVNGQKIITSIYMLEVLSKLKQIDLRILHFFIIQGEDSLGNTPKPIFLN